MRRDLLLSPLNVFWMVTASLLIVSIAIAIYEATNQKKTMSKQQLPKNCPEVRLCQECGKAPIVMLEKGHHPTEVFCQDCDRLASSRRSPKSAIEIWNQMNKEKH